MPAETAVWEIEREGEELWGCYQAATEGDGFGEE